MLQPRFSKFDKRIFFIGINIMVAYLLFGYLYLGMGDPANFPDIQTYNMANFHYYSFFATLVWIIAIPFIGKANNKIKSIKIMIFLVFLLKFSIISIFELINFLNLSAGVWKVPHLFPGQFDFDFMYDYLGNYLQGSLPTQYGLEIYYPPGVPIIYLFFFFLNPMQSSFFYHIEMLIYEALIYYMIYKIANLKKINIKRPVWKRGIIYAFFGASFISVTDLFGKYDTLVILLSMIGIYLYFKPGKELYSTIFLTFCALIKLYTALWIAGIILLKIKQKKLLFAFKYLFVSLLTGFAILSFAFFFEGLKFFEILLSFKFQIHDVYVTYTLNIWFFLQYLPVPFINLLPYALLIFSFLYFITKWKGDINLSFFIRITAITLLFFPAINSLYIQWIFPLMCIDMLGSFKKMKILAILEIMAMHAEQSFNFYAVYSGIGLPVFLDLNIFPNPLIFWWRVANLGFFFALLLILIFPEKFKRFFPPIPLDEIRVKSVELS